MPRTSSPRKSKTPTKQTKIKAELSSKPKNDMETNQSNPTAKAELGENQSTDSDIEDNEVSSLQPDTKVRAKALLSRRRTASASGTSISGTAPDRAKQSPPKGRSALDSEVTGRGPWGHILVLVLITFVLLAIFYGGGNEVIAQRRQATRRYTNIQSDNSAFNREAKAALETFHGDLKHDKYLGAIKHAKVLQIESVPEHFREIERVLKDIFPTTEFDRLVIDGSDRDARLNSDFFVPFDDSRPLVIMVMNVHRASSSLLRSLAHSMSSPVLEVNGRTRSPHNVGFLILGTSLSPDAPCHTLNLLEHDRDILGWSPTFLTRITDQAKVC